MTENSSEQTFRTSDAYQNNQEKDLVESGEDRVVPVNDVRPLFAWRRPESPAPNSLFIRENTYIRCDHSKSKLSPGKFATG